MKPEVAKPEYISVRHPGEYLDEIARGNKLITDRIAGFLQTKRKTVEQLFKGKLSITPVYAQRLEQFTGVHAAQWMSMQIEYDQQLIRLKYADKLTQLRNSNKGCRMRSLYF